MEAQEPKTFKEFLEKSPPGREVEVSDAFTQPKLPPPPLSSAGSYVRSNVKRDLCLLKPELELYCDNEKCKREMSFNSNNDPGKDGLNDEINNYKFMRYTCNNCKKYIKVFAVRIQPLQKNSKVFKFGEFPYFGPPTPALAITLIGGDKELFHKGQRAEDQGLGIGAFAYYRRVVENQKNRIFDVIIRATKKISPDDPVIPELEAAKNENQFINAVGRIKKALPESLLIKGYNPLTLLHNALSKRLHNCSDDECLQFASDIRRVLFLFAKKLGEVIKDQAEIDAAVERLTKDKEK